MHDIDQVIQNFKQLAFAYRIPVDNNMSNNNNNNNLLLASTTPQAPSMPQALSMPQAPSTPRAEKSSSRLATPQAKKRNIQHEGRIRVDDYDDNNEVVFAEFAKLMRIMGKCKDPSLKSSMEECMRKCMNSNGMLDTKTFKAQFTGLLNGSEEVDKKDKVVLKESIQDMYARAKALLRSFLAKHNFNETNKIIMTVLMEDNIDSVQQSEAELGKRIKAQYEVLTNSNRLSLLNSVIFGKSIDHCMAYIQTKKNASIVINATKFFKNYGIELASHQLRRYRKLYLFAKIYPMVIFSGLTMSEVSDNSHKLHDYFKADSDMWQHPNINKNLVVDISKEKDALPLVNALSASNDEERDIALKAIGAIDKVNKFLQTGGREDVFNDNNDDEYFMQEMEYEDLVEDSGKK